MCLNLYTKNVNPYSKSWNMHLILFFRIVYPIKSRTDPIEIQRTSGDLQGQCHVGYGVWRLLGQWRSKCRLQTTGVQMGSKLSFLSSLSTKLIPIEYSVSLLPRRGVPGWLGNSYFGWKFWCLQSSRQTKCMISMGFFLFVITLVIYRAKSYGLICRNPPPSINQTTGIIFVLQLGDH